MKPPSFKRSLLAAAALALTTSSVALADENLVKPDSTMPSAYVRTPLNARTPSPTSTTPAALETEPRYTSSLPNKTLLVAGGVLLLAAYAPTVILTAASNNPNADRVLYLPLIGPWAHLASPTATTSVTTVDTMLVVGSGVAQGLGAALMLTSLFVPGRVPVPTLRAGDTTIHLGPTSFGPTSAGAGAVGSF